MKIGVLALQGDFAEHVHVLRRIGADSVTRGGGGTDIGALTGAGVPSMLGGAPTSSTGLDDGEE